MSLSVAAQRTGYPLASYAYSVTVGSDAMSFNEVSGLVREHEVLTYGTA
jgi:hypothetical protein